MQFSHLKHLKFRKNSETVRKYYINDQVDIETFLDFILCHVLLKIVLFY